jgi:uncharacterized protein YaaN involved in tellurite resistance
MTDKTIETLSAPCASSHTNTMDSPAPAEQIGELADSIDLLDPGLSVTYGAKAMVNISRFASDLLGRIRAQDSGPMGEILADLLLRVKDTNFVDLKRSRFAFPENLPLIGSLFNSMARSIAKFDTLAEQIDSIAGKLDQAMVGLLRDIEILEQLYEHNKNFHNELSLFIAAGKQRLEQACAIELPRRKEKAEACGDAMAAQSVRDFADALNRFERRLHDLQISRALSLQTAPQIRLLQNNNQILAEKIQAGILTTIPVWKSQMVLALSLHSQKTVAGLQKGVDDTTNELLRRNADALQTATVETAREVERSLVDIETLREVHAKLMSTIEETLRISQEGKATRREAEKELAGMEQNLRERLSSFAAAGAAQTLEQAEK